MKQFLLFLFVLLFPVLFVFWWICALTYQLIKHSFLYVWKVFFSNQKEVNGPNIS